MLENKRSVSMLSKSPDCPLTCKQLYVYSYMAYQSQFDKPKSYVGIARYLCLSRDGVADIASALDAHGLTEGKTALDPCPRPDWFLRSPKLAKRFAGEHWTKAIVNWKAYVRAPGSALKFAESILLSLLWSHHQAGYAPPRGYTDAYLSTVTGLAPSMVGPSMAGLGDKGFLVRTTEAITLYQMSPEMLACFADEIDAAPRQAGAVLVVAAAPAPLKSAPTSDDDVYTDRPVPVMMANTEYIEHLRQTLILCDFREEEYEPVLHKVQHSDPIPKARWEAVTKGILAALDRRRHQASGGGTPVHPGNRIDPSGSHDPGPLGILYSPTPSGRTTS